jgi:hypothetical protein
VDKTRVRPSTETLPDMQGSPRGTKRAERTTLRIFIQFIYIQRKSRFATRPRPNPPRAAECVEGVYASSNTSLPRGMLQNAISRNTATSREAPRVRMA